MSALYERPSVVTADGEMYDLSTCRSCKRDIYWGTTRRGKRCPYDVLELDSGELVGSGMSHFRSCPEADHWAHVREKTAVRSAL